MAHCGLGTTPSSVQIMKRQTKQQRRSRKTKLLKCRKYEQRVDAAWKALIQHTEFQEGAAEGIWTIIDARKARFAKGFSGLTALEGDGRQWVSMLATAAGAVAGALL